MRPYVHVAKIDIVNISDTPNPVSALGAPCSGDLQNLKLSWFIYFQNTSQANLATIPATTTKKT